jgi:uncharacterized protein YdaU (DUF1376 family)
MEFGKPINVGEYLAENAHLTPQEQTNGMKDLLTERLHATLFRIPNDEDYDATYEVCNAVESIEVEKLPKAKEHSLETQFQANNNTLKRIEELKESKPEQAQKLLELGDKAHRLRKKKGISVESASVKKPLTSRMTRTLLTLITLPYTIPASVLASPVALICKYIFTMLKDPAFKNSVRYVMILVIWPLLVMIYAIIACCLLSWQWALLATLLTMPAPYVAHALWKSIRLVVSDIRLLREKKLRKIYSQIREIVIGK